MSKSSQNVTQKQPSMHPHHPQNHLKKAIRASLNYTVAPNLSMWWSFGSVLCFLLVLQIITGILLAFHYKPDVTLAFASVQKIMSIIPNGWLVRGMHSIGANFYFLALYLHIFKGIYYGSYKYPRQTLWQLGMLLFLLSIISAFTGYTLPWGQLSYWSATVISEIPASIPLIGPAITSLIRGGDLVADPTLMRFYVIHIIMPFLIIAVVALHVWTLRQVKNNNPLGIDFPHDKMVPFHPYYTVKDALFIALILIPFSALLFFWPNVLLRPENMISANPLQTPLHIAPEWYLAPFYAILRAIPFKMLGALALFASFAVLFLLPRLDKSPIRSAKFRPLFRPLVCLFAVNFVALIYLGTQPLSGLSLHLAQACTFIYFAFFMLLPVLTRYEKPSAQYALKYAPKHGHIINQNNAKNN